MSRYLNNDFPFDTGSQIWGSAAAADLDGDGYLEFIIPSKSKHMYIFDFNGLKVDYETDVYLIGTPAIGNLDDDDEKLTKQDLDNIPDELKAGCMLVYELIELLYERLFGVGEGENGG